MKAFFKKLTSRKFIVAAVIVAIGIAISLGVDASTIDRLIGAITSLIGGLSYIIAEGAVDVKRVQSVVEDVKTVAETIEEVKEDLTEGE